MSNIVGFLRRQQPRVGDDRITASRASATSQGNISDTHRMPPAYVQTM